MSISVLFLSIICYCSCSMHQSIAKLLPLKLGRFCILVFVSIMCFKNWDYTHYSVLWRDSDKWLLIRKIMFLFVMYHLNFWWFYSLHLVVEFHYQMQGRRRENNADKLEVFLSSFKVGEVCMFYSRVCFPCIRKWKHGVNNARIKTVAREITKTSTRGLITNF